MSNMISIEGYLIQSKLEAALKAIVGEGWIGRELKVIGTHRRWDMAYRLRGATTVVEFDGDEHYRNTLKIKTDREKDAIAISLGYSVVRVPYWVQLTTETLKYYFALDGVVKQSFPHGFIATKIFPASFCGLGLERFRGELEALPNSVKDSVIKSLEARSAEHGLKYVLPEQLADLIPIA
jgi:hypothetical protein